jgi:hypothetical protein
MTAAGRAVKMAVMMSAGRAVKNGSDEGSRQNCKKKAVMN